MTMINDHDIEQIRDWAIELDDAPVHRILRWADSVFGDRLALASSMGAEDQVLTDLIARHWPQVEIFTLDTGRLFPETLDLIQTTSEHYGKAIRVYAPDHESVEQMVGEHGVNLFRRSVELRKQCCAVRKVEPLLRALKGVDAWITGLRSGQAATRGAVDAVEWDAAHGKVKINPLHKWDEEQVWTYIREHRVPYNPLHDRGFPSIGCAPCTRAIRPGEDVRAGRWWWEAPEHRECGLHRREENLRGEKEAT